MRSLPPGYTVVADPAVGVSYLDEDGYVVLQHPNDSDSARALVWQIYRRKQGR